MRARAGKLTAQRQGVMRPSMYFGLFENAKEGGPRPARRAPPPRNLSPHQCRHARPRGLVPGGNHRTSHTPMVTPGYHQGRAGGKNKTKLKRKGLNKNGKYTKAIGLRPLRVRSILFTQNPQRYTCSWPSPTIHGINNEYLRRGWEPLSFTHN